MWPLACPVAVSTGTFGLMAGRGTLPKYGGPPRIPCERFIKGKDRMCHGLAEPGARFCRFHGGRAPAMKKKADEVVEDYRQQIIDLGEHAILTLQEKLSSPNHAVALRAALEVLAIAGVSGTKKTESHVTVTQKSELDDRIEALLSGFDPQTRPDMLGVSTGSTDSDDERDE